MSKKAIPYIFLLVLMIAIVIIQKYNNSNSKQKSTSIQKDPSQEENRSHGFNRRISYLEYTKHAKCRMDCRHITQPEVEEILRNGTINERKSDMNGTPCPTYAVEGTTSENQRLRIVFAQCDNETKVVTCIDLGKEWQCHCPGDADKYDNRN